MVEKDARVIELILRILGGAAGTARCARGRASPGFVMANAGIDFSNVTPAKRTPGCCCQPADGECERLRKDLHERAGASVAIIINDSHGRAWRNGTVGVAIGASGIPALLICAVSPTCSDARCASHRLAWPTSWRQRPLLMGQAMKAPPSLVRGLRTRSDSRPSWCGRKSWTCSVEDGDAPEIIRQTRDCLATWPPGAARSDGT
jgi:coenzyme F420-0:L-glutamate ligase/coenzyme F420-1:gamma-L-glutamate ligase